MPRKTKAEQTAVVDQFNAAIMAKEEAYKSNPLYYAWDAHGLVQGQGLSGWDVCQMGEDIDFKKFGEVYTSRDTLTRKYAWAIPSPEAIAWIAERVKSVVEIGAGRGYWAKLLSAAGIEVAAYDTSVAKGKMGKNGYHQPRIPKVDALTGDIDPTLYFPVKHGGAAKAADHPGSTLMLCWPPYHNHMARQSLKYYQGDSLLYIGEWDGCCAEPKFFEQLDRDWKEVGMFDIPQWPGIRDRVCFLERK